MKIIYLILLLYDGGGVEIHMDENKERIVYNSGLVFSSLLRRDVTRSVV